jgi:hypothetical protein
VKHKLTNEEKIKAVEKQLDPPDFLEILSRTLDTMLNSDRFKEEIRIKVEQKLKVRQQFLAERCKREARYSR